MDLQKHLPDGDWTSSLIWRIMSEKDTTLRCRSLGIVV
jgi:hypothetical protein